MENLKTLADVERYGAESGLILTPSDKAKIALAQKAELERLQSLTPPTKQNFADRFNAYYPRLLQALTAVGEVILTFSQTVIVSLGVPAVLVLLLIVEHQRVVHGIMLFEADYSLAGFASFALVMLNLVLEFQTHYIEHRAGYEQSLSRRWSLRLWVRGMSYRLGLGGDWKEIELSPASRYKALLRLVTFTILALALVGSMRGVIEQTPGAWYQALVSIVTESDLLLIMTWLGGLLFAVAAVLSAQGLSRYVAIRCVEILANMQTDKETTITPHAGAVEQAGANVALALIREKQAKLDAKKKPVEVGANSPFGSIHPAPVDHEFMPIPAPANGTGNGNGHKLNGN